MKQKTITLLFITALVLTFASCLSNNDDDKNTNYAADYKNAVGQYTGKMYALDYKNPLKPDTLMHDVVAVVSGDSLITFSDFPLYFIMKELANTELREAAIAKGNTPMKVRYAIYDKSDDYLYNFFYPQSVTINDIDYKGGKHKLTVSFVQASQGFFYPRKYIQVPMYIGGVYLDDILLEDFVNNKTALRCLVQFQGGA